MASRNMPSASSLAVPRPAALSMHSPNAKATAMTSSGPRPFKASSDSAISRLFPTARPSGCSMSEMRPRVGRPAFSPMATMAWHRRRASRSSLMKAPLPVLTSSTMPSVSRASFLLMIEEAMSGMLATVAVASRSA